MKFTELSQSAFTFMNIYTGQMFQPNVFPFLIKLKPRKIQVSGFELWVKSRYPLLLSQKYGMDDTNHSIVTGFFKSSKTLVRHFLDEKVFFWHVAFVLTCFQSEKSQNKLDLMESFLLKRFTKLVKLTFRGCEAKKSHLSNFPILTVPKSVPKHYLTSCQDFPHQNF